jgi:hypothetical protein
VKYAVEVDADMGRFPKEWLFHHRWGKKPGKVNGNTFFTFSHDFLEHTWAKPSLTVFADICFFYMMMYKTNQTC